MGRQRLLRPLLACDVLVLDELGYLPTLPGFGPALYELIAGRYERRPTLITGNGRATHGVGSNEVTDTHRVWRCLDSERPQHLGAGDETRRDHHRLPRDDGSVL